MIKVGNRYRTLFGRVYYVIARLERGRNSTYLVFSEYSERVGTTDESTLQFFIFTEIV